MKTNKTTSQMWNQAEMVISPWTLVRILWSGIYSESGIKLPMFTKAYMKKTISYSLESADIVNETYLTEHEYLIKKIKDEI